MSPSTAVVPLDQTLPPSPKFKRHMSFEQRVNKTSISWTEACHKLEKSGRVILPGDPLHDFFDRRSSAQLAHRSIWFAQSRARSLLAIFTNTIFFIFFGGNGLICYRFCGMSIYSSVGIVFFGWAMIYGKAMYIFSELRTDPESKAMVPVLLLPPDLAARVKAMRPNEIMPSHAASTLMVVCTALCLIPGPVLFAMGGWELNPRWSSIYWVCFIPMMAAFTTIAGNFLVVTELFVRSSHALVLCLRNFKIFVDRASESADEGSGRGTIDWAATYRNYDKLCEIVDEYSRAWSIYFFCVEFSNVPSFVLMFVGLIENCVGLRVAALALMSPALDTDAEAAALAGMATLDEATARAILLQKLGCVLLTAAYAFFFGVLHIIVGLWIRASQVTAACDGARTLALSAISHAAQAGSVEERESARTFVLYTEQMRPGFSCNGFTISYHLGMLFAYPLVTGTIALALPLATLLLPSVRTSIE